ncbi:MAG TPA: peptidoglycan DD-metalloendopeptidase family protein [Gemmatimonadales bacterium]|jgi:murein DD-endopeptidase MepM/ murein hydrolase activator NlpD
MAGLRAARVAAVAATMVGAWLAARSLWFSQRIPIAPPIVVSQAYAFQLDTLRRDETLSHLFARHGISGQDLLDFLGTAEVLDPRRTRAGQVFEFRSPLFADRADRVRVRLGDVILLASRDSLGAWDAAAEEVVWSPQVARASGTIQSTLEATVRQMIPDSMLPERERTRLTLNIADGVFGWVIDFTRDIYPDDRIAVVFEREESSAGDVRVGRVLAVQLESRGRANQAFLLEDGAGRQFYYDEQGQSLRRAFRRYPVEYDRITSGFSRRRLHPVLQRYRAHRGVDFSAPTGTPILATADGTVSRAGSWGTYGIAVGIRHARGVETRYAHMSRVARGIRAGVRVVQGQVIGYSGMTGLASGPHVHYEFLQNGRHVNPSTAVQYGMGDPVPRARRDEFDELRDRYLAMLTTPAQETAAADGD